MKVMDVARTLGLVATDGEVTGTIDQQRVLDALAELAESDKNNADLVAFVAEQVRAARSAGVEVHDPHSVRVRPDGATTTQLRYRSEMADLFTDLAIDVGLRHHEESLVTTT